MGPAKQTKSSGSKISFEPRAEEGRSIGESKIHVDPRAEEEQNHSKPRAEEERDTTSNLVRKRKEVIKSVETLNLAQTEEQSISLLRFPDLVRKGEGTSKLSKRFEPRAKENANRKIHQKFLKPCKGTGGRISGIIIMGNLE